MKKILSLIIIMASLLFVVSCAAADSGSSNNFYPSELMPSNQPNLDSSGNEYLELKESTYVNTMDNNKVNVSLDSSTAAYANLRKLINNNMQISKDAVNIEQMLNYFNYSYVNDSEEQLKSYLEMGVCPWNPSSYLLSVAVQAKELVVDESRPNNFVFLIDVSGSMFSADKLPLLKEAFRILVDNLGENDRVSILTYASGNSIALDGAFGYEKAKINDVMAGLQAGGSTAGAQGIKGAYELARKYYIDGGNNRVFLATDGDFNVGISKTDELKEFISEQRQTGIYLSLFGFGQGNLKSDKMDTLAQAGNGNYYYIDSILEAKKIFVTELGGTLQTVAKDAKVQVQFNPEMVEKYRLIGYENKQMTNEEFDNNETDAGEIGAGHTTVCLIEVVLKPGVLEDTWIQEVARCVVRYKDVFNLDTDREVVTILNNNDLFKPMSNDFIFQAAVVEFALVVRNSDYKFNANCERVIERINNVVFTQDSYKAEFVELVLKYMRDYQ